MTTMETETDDHRSFDIAERKNDEEYIGHQAAIVQSSGDAIISRSLSGIIKSWNKGGEKMFGYTTNEAVGQPISLIIPQEYLEQEKNIFDRICNNETIDNYETLRIKKNGEVFHVSLTVSPIKDPKGKIIGISKIARDISSHKKFEIELLFAYKELALQKEEMEKRAMELVIANKELAFQNTEKEKRAEELVIANAELVFQNKEKEKRASELLIANKELAFQNKEKEKRAQELAIANAELLFQNREKGKRASELIIANKELAFQNDEKGKRAAELGIANKELIFQYGEKEKRQTENIELEAFSKTLKHSSQYARSLIEASLDPLVTISTEGKITDVNEASVIVTGVSRDKLIGTDFSDYFTEPEKAREGYKKGFEKGFVSDYPLIIKHKDGKLTDVLYNASVYKDDKGNVLGVFAAARDVTAQKAMELVVANKELAFQNKEKEKRAEELVIANAELVFQNKEKEKRAEELVIANAELVFQNKEKEKRAEELVIANAELVFQNHEKGKRASELIIANKELAFQNDEKGKRAEELAIANAELLFQNREKGKRASELIIANKELAFQNDEKGNRASELVIANKELAYQEEEKEKRASELIIANIELIYQNKEKLKRNIYIAEMKVVQEQNRLLTENLTIHNKQLANFAHITSHNLRSPVANLNALFSIYKEEQNDEEKNDLLDKFERVILHLTNTLNDLCESLIISADINKTRQLLSFEDILNKTMEILTGQVIETKAEITFDFSKAPQISYPHIYLESIFLNLLSNSIKYHAEKRVPKIHFETDNVNGEITLVVKDNGIGIDLEKHGSKLFGLHKVFHRNKDARGVGLYLTKTHIEAMGGTIIAHSAVNEGISFKINFNKLKIHA